MLYASLLKYKYLLTNDFKKTLYTKVNTMYKNEYTNEYVNIYVNKKHLNITNATCCKYCKGTGWIIWKTNNLCDLKTNKSLVPTFSYSLCYKCNDF